MLALLKKYQRFGWIGLGVVLLVGFIWLIKPSGARVNGGHFDGQGPIPVGVATAHAGDIHIVLNGLGTVTPLATVEVRPQASGPIVAINFNEGQMVKAGDVLARIDPRPYQAALDQAKATLMRDAASLANARRDLGRYQALAKLNAISAQTVATQAMTVKQDEGAVAADRAGVETAALNLSYTDIKAPVSGRVGLRQVDLGNLVTANQATAIAVVTEVQPMSVLFAVPEDNIDAVMSAVRAGKSMEVVAYDRNDSTKLATGRLESVDNQIDPSTGTVKLRALFDNEDGALFPNQFVNVRLTVRTLHDQTVVPGAALQQGADGAYVFVVSPDKTVSMRAVTPGPVDGANVAVDKGLKPGDTVVVDGADRLTDGAEVTMPNAPGKAIARPSAAPKGSTLVAQAGRRGGMFALFRKLTPEERQKLRAMSRADRIAWLRAHKDELAKRSTAPVVAQ
ncbi:MAG: MdtA/MuxA family multidrug efflux RND transporter periplasmic adaptor subunit [Alphaproteobacteria bacterium]|nr:MdtA/MuxA family multidrug efflux RND transporter periplasmic adaptor subunit [Alphaproteobacteria bacterium]